MTPVLETHALSVSFGGVRAVVDVDLRIEPGQLVGLIGPNGAGKTTFIDAISGFVPYRGSVMLDGNDLAGKAPHVRARLGLARTWQSIELFDDLTVRENIAVASQHPSAWSAVREVVSSRPTEGTTQVDDALRIVRARGLSEAMPSELSQAHRKLVGVARALAASPRLLCLDEPAAGLDTLESEALGRHLREIVDRGTTMLLVDHDMGLVLSISDYVVVLEFGEVIADGHAGGRPQRSERDQRLPRRRRSGGVGRARRRRGSRLVSTVLQIEGLTAGYDQAAVIRDVDLTVDAGEVVALLGANGAGKTTTLRVISGIVKPSAGRILLDGRDLVSVSPSARARSGIAHVPEGRGIFFGLTVAEHFRLGHRGEQLDEQLAYTYFPKLEELRQRRAGLLSGGEQQMLAIGRALARHPHVLLLDELSLGLAPVIVEALLPTVREYALESGCAVLLVEQHVHLALEVADRGYVLSHGEVVLHKPAEELRRDRHLLIASYLGEQQAGGSQLDACRAVRLPHGLDVRYGADDRAQLRLDVGLDGRLRGAAVLLAPDESHLAAGLRVLRVDDGEREHLPLVRGVADPRRDADGLAVDRDAVVRVHRVDGGRPVHELRPVGRLEHRADRARDVLVVERQRHLPAMVVVRHAPRGPRGR